MTGGYAMNNTDFYRSISPLQAMQMLQDIATYTVVIDVRTSEEYRPEHIRGAVNIPLDLLEEKIAASVPDRQQEIILYCRSGNRSKEAAHLLSSMGYSNVFDLGAISDWPFEKESLPDDIP